MKKLILFCMTTFLSLNLSAQTWTGGVDTNWFNAGNWTPSGVPASNANIHIPSLLSTYPSLTANVVVGGLKIDSGAQINISGYSFVDSGNVDLYKAKITGGGSFSVINSPSSVKVISSTLTATILIKNYRSLCYFFDDTVTGNVTIADSSNNTTSANYIDGNYITGDITLVHAPDYNGYSMSEGYGSPSGNGNRVTGNALFKITGKSTFNSCYSHPIRVDGNLTVIRDSVGSSTNLFMTGGSQIGGNFSLTTRGSNTSLNSANLVQVNIGGTLNISAPNFNNYSFTMNKIKNNTAGGSIQMENLYSLTLMNDSIKAYVAITNYRSSTNILDNSILGNALFSDSSDINTNTNNIDGNLITGDLTLVHAPDYTGYPMHEGYGSPSGNSNWVMGNALFKITGKSTFNSSYSHPIRVNGNLTVIRDSVGSSTNLFMTGGSQIGGNFSLTTRGSNTSLNSANLVQVNIGGALNISAPNFNNYSFTMNKIKNNSAGGAIQMDNLYSLTLMNDSIKAYVAITNYRSITNILDNSILGNALFSDSSDISTNTNNIDGNLITGDLTLVHAPDYTGYSMSEGYGSPSGNGNRVTGNALFHITGKATFFSSFDHPIRVDGNFTVIRDSVGSTMQLFRTGGSQIGGNFSLTTRGSNTSLNSANLAQVNIGGTLNISAPNFNGYSFTMNKIKNNTIGGSIQMDNLYQIIFRQDTIKASVSFTNYNNAVTIYDNSILGNTLIDDSSTNTSGTNYIDGNLITGDLTLVHAPDYVGYGMYEGFGSPSGNGNRVTGNALFHITGKSNFYSSYNHPLTVLGNLTILRDMPGNTELYRTSTSASTVGGDFTFTNAGGLTNINLNASAVVNIAGKITLNMPDANNAFTMKKMKNNTPGGQIYIGNASTFRLSDDTLLADVKVDSFTSNLYFLSNQITGNTFIEDLPNSSGSQYLDGNNFLGNLSLVHHSTYSQFYDGYGALYGNHVTGVDSLVNMPGAQNLNLSYSNTHQADSDFVVNAGSGILIPRIIFGGTTNGQLIQANTQNFSISDVTINKTGNRRLIIDSSLLITDTLRFVKGHIESSPSHPLIFKAGAAHKGADDTSHVIGYVMKIGTTAFTFPLGDTDHYSPIGITYSVRATDTFAAQYFPIAPDTAGYDSSQHDASIHHISSREYWLLDRNSYSPLPVNVILGFVRNNSGKIDNLSDLTVAHWYGSPAKWHDEGNATTTGTNNLGTITCYNPISDFSPFTLASTSSSNPLPIRIASFDAQKSGSSAQISWVVNQEKGIDHFEVARSLDGNTFKTIAQVKPTGSNSNTGYRSFDNNPVLGVNFYRLAIVSTDGTYSYSATKALNFAAKAHDHISIYPNPTLHEITIDAGPEWADATVRIQDLMGREMSPTKLSQDGNAQIDLSKLPAGIYHLELSTAEQHYQTNIIKQ
ncbi:MAG: T9SS type A sorting domain-containing protein [Bacteroidetes bacterium]|nr:T9SS type A sorting domain-containing protein [Bacteroidota bacterium]